MTDVTDPYSLAVIADWFYKQGKEEVLEERKKERRRRKNKMKNISVRMPEAILHEIDKLVIEGYFENRNDALREAARQLIIKYNEMKKKTIPETIQG